MKVRDAVRSDLIHVAYIADVALRSAYADLLPPTTLDRYLAATYSEVALITRLADHPIFLVEIDHEVCAFADGFIQDGGIVVAEICTSPNWRRQGCATELIDRLAHLDAALPVSADVLLGNETGERFYESLGFVPREIMQMQMFDTVVVERRWWHPPAVAAS